MSSGDWLFCFANTCGHYKIGKTTNVIRRVNQLKKEGPYIICFAKQITDSQIKVKIIHSLLIKYKNSDGLFEIKNINVIKQLFDLIEGVWYEHNVKRVKPTPKQDAICNEDMIRQYLQDRKRQSVIDDHFKMGGSNI